jgi:hypothetical protein
MRTDVQLANSLILRMVLCHLQQAIREKKQKGVRELNRCYGLIHLFENEFIDTNHRFDHRETVNHNATVNQGRSENKQNSDDHHGDHLIWTTRDHASSTLALAYRKARLFAGCTQLFFFMRRSSDHRKRGARYAPDRWALHAI